MKSKRLLAIILCVFLSFSAFVTYAQDTQNTENKPILEDGKLAKTLITQSANLIIAKYKDEVSREDLYEKTLMKLMEEHPELIEDAYRAIFSDLDEHTVYYTDEEFNYFLDSMSGEFAGIGVIISYLDDGLLVVSVTDDSSAYAAGIRQGDIIVSADGLNLVGMQFEKARSYIVGEIGTTVEVGIVREGQPMSFTVMRKKVSVESVNHEIIDDNIGYIILESFDETSPELVNRALDEFDKKGITDIIFDLRYNSGGSVNAYSKICQRIIPQGPIIHFEYKNEGSNRSLYSNCANPKYTVVVLANEYTASASEAFCGAVQDSGIGIVVGTGTYGKGTMQNLTNFRVGGGVKMTEAEYLTRNKRHIDKVGIEPDVYENDKTIRLNRSGYNDLDFESKLKLGDSGPVVLAINQRLWAMGYDVGIPTDTYTQKTHDAIYTFQSSQGLFPYGVCDISTQLAMENIMQTLEFSDNMMFKKALEIVKTKTVDSYIKEDAKDSNSK